MSNTTTQLPALVGQTHQRCRICGEVLELGKRDSCSDSCARALRLSRVPRRERRARNQSERTRWRDLEAPADPPGGYPPSGSPGDRRGGLRQVRRPMNLNGWTVSDGSAT